MPNRLFERGRNVAARLLRFLLWGIPGFVTAFSLNYALVRGLGAPPFAAYLPVLFGQMLVNYTMCRHKLFPEEAKQHPFWSHFLRFAMGSLGFRLLDWLLYGLLTQAGVYYLAAQSFNIALFAALRFRYVESLFGRRPTGSSRPSTTS